MKIKLFRTDGDLSTALALMEQLWGAPIGTPEGDALEADRHPFI